ncbi:DHHC zinc finger membrane protein [Taphrina deformans PYCC 5710]|uniref:DHHC zinc finger membrane protein n=1 Tax=Taphrina deformans (strain PYCC 5710 / ATCC 11124 / CBS 356.35 / IMI 108563 / JCM 9778 / NBRC 8474) TaxID=1097556 RepID=R4X6Z5_TAPDE|nr:DHHC zinc finger membrane protein [Taphrina deformans PYCC 5710]|eukprot:CCG81012.1 DHHC zinc finger membrane protein [Taphrina deformans PYCC 5710]
MVLNLIGASAVCLMTACLHFYQLWCAIENITTIESWNKSRVEALIRKKKIVPIDFPYDLYTIKENLREIMGHHNPLLWLWPPSGATGTGHEFPVNEDADLSRTWPPKDPDAVMESQTSAAKIRPLLEGEVQPIVEAEIVDSWDEYAEAGLIAESDASEDDYANEEGEYLDSYGVDDEDETSALEELVGADLTLGQLLSKRRSIKIEAVAQKYADSRKTR